MSRDNNGTTFTDSYVPKINAVAQSSVDDLIKEKAKLSEDSALLIQVIDDAIDRIYATGRIPGRDLPADVYKQKPIKLAQNVYLPVKQYPTFNFKGKIIGPKGNTLKRLHNETLCNIAVKGRTCMRDEEREEESRQSGDPAFNHLNKNLHVEISTVAPPAEAYARMAYALSEIRKYIIPDKNDEISQEQYRELIEMNPEYAKKTNVQRSVFGKLQQMKGGLGGTIPDRHDDSFSNPNYNDEYHGKPRYNDDDQGSSPNVRATGPPPSSFVDKIKDMRTKPYQKYSPFKK